MKLDSDTTVREGRDQYLSANGFDMEAYTSPTVTMPIFGRPVKFPNPPTRQRVIARHDLHHALTGYGTDYIGEAEIGAWEVRAGCNTVFLYAINLLAVGLGLFLSPRRVWAAFRAAKGHRSLYVDERPIEALLAMRLGDLREERGIPREGIVVTPVMKSAPDEDSMPAESAVSS